VFLLASLVYLFDSAEVEFSNWPAALVTGFVGRCSAVDYIYEWIATTGNYPQLPAGLVNKVG
jgi:hypothetical protein